MTERRFIMLEGKLEYKHNRRKLSQISTVQLYQIIAYYQFPTTLKPFVGIVLQPLRAVSEMIFKVK